MPVLKGFIGPSYRVRSINADPEEAINLFCEEIESGAGKDAYYMRPRSGYLSVWSNPSGNAKVRGMMELNGHVFACVGNMIYDFLTDGAATESWIINASYGPIADDDTPVYFCANRDTLVFVSAQTPYMIFGGALSVISWLPDVLCAGYINTFFVFLAATFDGFYYSEPDEPNTGDVLNFVSAEADANNYIRLIVDHQQVILFGNRRTQVFETTSDPEFPFAAVVSSGVIQHGIAATGAVIQADNSLHFLGGDQLGRGMFWRLDGYTPRRTSDHGVEYAIRSYATVTDAVTWAYQEDGHIFIVLTFPTQGVTWCKDVTTGFWHRRAFWNTTTGVYEADRGYCSTAAFGNVYVGDRANGKIYKQSMDYATDNGTIIRWLRRSPDYAHENHWVRYDCLELVFQAGFGGTVQIRWSDDNGYTYSNQRSRSLGATGYYATRVYVNRCGMGRNRVWEAVGTGQGVLVGAYFKGKVLDN